MKGNLKEDDDKNKQTNKQTENKTERNNTKKKGRVFQIVDCQWTGLLMGLKHVIGFNALRMKVLGYGTVS